MQRIVAEAPAGESELAPIPADVFAEAHLDRVLRFATLVSPPGTDPEDVAQEAMVAALARLDRFDPARGSVDAWLWRIVVNRARDAGRAARRSELLLERLRVLRHHDPTGDTSPEQVV